MLSLNAVQTVAFGGVCLIAGYRLRRRVALLSRFNVPAPVIGGLVIALILSLCHHAGVTPVRFDDTFKEPLMIAFFTSIGFSASTALLRIAGRQMVVLLGLTTVLLVVQNFVGMGVARAFGLPPMFGVAVGSATLAGGPSTGLAFSPLFTQAGVQGAEAIVMASAMAGIVLGSLLGAPLATVLIEKYRLRPGSSPDADADVAAARRRLLEAAGTASGDEPDMAYAGVRSFVLMLLAMGIGSWISGGFAAMGVNLPSYIGAMIVGALIRNVDDRLGWFGLRMRHVNMIGGVSLSLFLVVALMELHLWELAGVALPLLVNLAVQTVIVALFCVWPLLRVMGRDYDAAVMSAGFSGYMLGLTANGIVVMESLTERYGASPRAFLVVPLVGGFLMDFVNSIAITVFLNVYR